VHGDGVLRLGARSAAENQHEPESEKQPVQTLFALRAPPARDSFGNAPI
jgi:hypothetical protein